MDNNLLVEIYCAATGIIYDAFIPKYAYLSEVLVLLKGILSDLSEGSYKLDDMAIICNFENGDIYNLNKLVYELGIKNGTRLMVI